MLASDLIRSMVVRMAVVALAAGQSDGQDAAPYITQGKRELDQGDYDRALSA